MGVFSYIYKYMHIICGWPHFIKKLPWHLCTYSIHRHCSSASHLISLRYSRRDIKRIQLWKWSLAVLHTRLMSKTFFFSVKSAYIHNRFKFYNSLECLINTMNSVIKWKVKWLFVSDFKCWKKVKWLSVKCSNY